MEIYLAQEQIQIQQADGSSAIISPTEEDYYNLDPIMIEYHYLYKNGEWICKEVNLKEYFNESSS